MDGPVTLAIDIGGTGLKADALDADGHMLVDRVRTRPNTRARRTLTAALRRLVAAAPAFDRVSAGFPGVVRKGLVLSAPHFVTVDGPGSHIDPELVKAWDHFDLAGALERTGSARRVYSTTPICRVSTWSPVRGVELVMTLGTGVGTATLRGRSPWAPPGSSRTTRSARARPTTNSSVPRARKRIGNKRWNRRLDKAIDNLRVLTLFDHLYLGGGNAEHADLPFRRRRHRHRPQRRHPRRPEALDDEHRRARALTRGGGNARREGSSCRVRHRRASLPYSRLRVVSHLH